MERRPFGPIRRDVAVIGQGTWYIDSGDRASAGAALRRGLDLGMTHIDTAEMYGDAEEVIAEAIVGRRDEVFLVSKVLPANASRRGTIAACVKSLTRLRTDRLDCYLLHWRGRHPMEETIGAFEQLQDEGKILSWGVHSHARPARGVPCRNMPRRQPGCAKNSVTTSIGPAPRSKFKQILNPRDERRILPRRLSGRRY
jgi:diketogulonate reductase-like aldo/keto reductase